MLLPGNWCSCHHQTAQQQLSCWPEMIRLLGCLACIATTGKGLLLTPACCCWGVHKQLQLVTYSEAAAMSSATLHALVTLCKVTCAVKSFKACCNCRGSQHYITQTAQHRQHAASQQTCAPTGAVPAYFLAV
jgi:hypothetical protein